MTSKLLTDFSSSVSNFIQDSESLITTTQIQEQCKAALEEYSHDVPDETVAEFAGDGGQYYGLTAKLTSWVDGFSTIVSVEYPAASVATDEEPQYLENEDFVIIEALADSTPTEYLYFPNHSPDSDETVRATYTLPYAFSGGTPAVDVPA